jgi:hypothetical protein
LGESEAPVEEVCGPGADPNFDQLISALGHIARQKPKPLIDTIMLWRKSKGDAAITARQMTNELVCFALNSPLKEHMRWLTWDDAVDLAQANGDGKWSTHASKYRTYASAWRPYLSRSSSTANVFPQPA